MKKPRFVEISFTLPFYEMYYGENWDQANIPKSPIDLLNIIRHLGIELNSEFLYNTYDQAKIGTGDQYFFFKKNLHEVFIYFDLYKDATDQMATVVFGLRQYSSRLASTLPLVEKIYFSSPTRSNLQIDYFNQILFRKSKTSIYNQQHNCGILSRI